jgi:hypothetical protein
MIGIDKLLPWGALILSFLFSFVVGCEDKTRASFNDDDDSDTWDDYDGPRGTLHGTVLAPSAEFPVAGALIYLTQNVPPSIPDGVHCSSCEDLTHAPFWTLADPNGTFALAQVPAVAEPWYFVVQKGLFRRVTEITVDAGDQDIPLQYTTLPGDNEGTDGLTVVPHLAVAFNTWDRVQDMLAKLGMGELDGVGHLLVGSENFDIYNDDDIADPGYPESSELYASLDSIKQYHMIFMPCTAGMMKDVMLEPEERLDWLRQYVSEGGRLYGSCYAYDWIEEPFHEYITFVADDPVTSRQANLRDSTVSAYDTVGRIEDQSMRDWLTVVAPTQYLDSYPFLGAWVEPLHTNDVADGHGITDNGGVVMPKTWVTDMEYSVGAPLTVTYDYDCGRVFFTAYQVVEDNPSLMIRPQEYVLLYLMMEVSVCSGTLEVD